MMINFLRVDGVLKATHAQEDACRRNRRSAQRKSVATQRAAHALVSDTAQKPTTAVAQHDGEHAEAVGDDNDK
jgi:hypothetical protein